MAKYYLSSGENNLNFTNITDFTELKHDDLSDIIKFTGIFKSESELKLYLMNHRLITTATPLKITYQYKNQVKNLKYGVTYYNDLKFFDERNLKTVIQRNKYNYEFLEALGNYLKDDPSQLGNYERIRGRMLLLKKFVVSLDDANEINVDFDYTVDDLVKRECHTYNYKEKKTNEKINFRGLRDLAMFLSYCEKRYDLIIENLNSNEYLEYADEHSSYEIEENIQEARYNQKIKTKKKDIKGQMTFSFDGNGNLGL